MIKQERTEYDDDKLECDCGDCEEKKKHYFHKHALFLNIGNNPKIGENGAQALTIARWDSLRSLNLCTLHTILDNCGLSERSLKRIYESDSFPSVSSIEISIYMAMQRGIIWKGVKCIHRSNLPEEEKDKSQ